MYKHLYIDDIVYCRTPIIRREYHLEPWCAGFAEGCTQGRLFYSDNEKHKRRIIRRMDEIGVSEYEIASALSISIRQVRDMLAET